MDVLSASLLEVSTPCMGVSDELLDIERTFEYNVVMYNYEDIDQWIIPLLPVQNSVKRYITVEQCCQLWKVSKGTAHRRLSHLVNEKLAERVKVGATWHFHIKG